MPGMQGGQAVAFRVSGDKAFFFGCGFYGAQDTLCDDAGRHYFRDCYIEGSIDFIFGNGRSLYKVRTGTAACTYICSALWHTHRVHYMCIRGSSC